MLKVIDFIFKPFLFIIVIYIALIMVLLGFITCWQCGKTKHLLTMKKYHLKLFDKKKLVCKGCYEVLTESR